MSDNKSMATQFPRTEGGREKNVRRKRTVVSWYLYAKSKVVRDGSAGGKKAAIVRQALPWKWLRQRRCRKKVTAGEESRHDRLICLVVGSAAAAKR